MNDSQPTGRTWAFVDRLANLDAGDRAHLKRSAGKSLDEAQRTIGLFYRLLSSLDVPVQQEPMYWLVATLYPLSDAADSGTFGSALHRARSTKYKKGLDRRVEALLDSDESQLAYRLGQAVRFLHSNRVPIYWPGLLDDLLQWEHPSRFVQKKWAKDYFSADVRLSISGNSQDKLIQEND